MRTRLDARAGEPIVARVHDDSAFQIRPIQAADNAAMAAIVIGVLTEHGCTGRGFALHDAETHALAESYAATGSRYFVLEHEGAVVGGGGFGRLEGSSTADATCELRKMYFLPGARGKGLGTRLLRRLLDEMRECDYRRCYLETASPMQKAQALYRREGFREQTCAEGSTGHHACDRFFARDL
ncbi:MAG: hypothetical protein RLZZ562_342 [Planctomycetota bacterium]|jgi:putative acetyltransferase